MKLNCFFILFCLVVVSSCTIEKRHYQNGYYISLKKSVKKSNQNTEVKSIEDFPNLNVSNISNNKSIKNEAIASNDIKNIALLYKKTSKIIKLPSDSCDILFLKNGKVIKIKTIEINESDIKYKRFDHLDGPNYVISKDDVKKIIYKNGLIEEFNTSKITDNKPIKKQPIKDNEHEGTYDSNSIISFICGLLGFILFFPAIVAVIFGMKSLKKIKDSNDSLKGKAFAIFGIIFGGIILVTAVLIFIFILLLLLIGFFF